jgi:hypothetical protein
VNCEGRSKQRQNQNRDDDGRAHTPPNDPSSATRPTRAFDCNLDAMAGLDAMKGLSEGAKPGHTRGESKP